MSEPAINQVTGQDWFDQADDALKVPVWDTENRARDREDEMLDAMRVHNGMTLDEFLAGTVTQ
jgi:hypothetical protein